MLGPIMQVKISDKLTIRLAPFAREDMGAFIKNGGMQSHAVLRYLSTPVQTLESEQEWYDKMRSDTATITWGIWDDSKKSPVLIGNTSLSHLEEFPLRQAVSGSMISDSHYWGKGIASAIHKARTWHAFSQLDLVRIKSAVLLPNIGSKKALSRSGYFVHSIERNVKFVDGQLLHQENMECLNPSDDAWRRWWHSERPSRAAIEAREVTRKALAWATTNVTLL
ncbi:MAG TPA: GNAT family N-acetyltransferase [Candidatus Saccharibacteria bacterium]|nr:GNAT family N-acetyltransferase [Candidatus Saccharibacteria bacterium]